MGCIRWGWLTDSCRLSSAHLCPVDKLLMLLQLHSSRHTANSIDRELLSLQMEHTSTCLGQKGSDRGVLSGYMQLEILGI